MKNFLKKSVIIAILAVFLGGIFAFPILKNRRVDAAIITAEKRTVTREITVSGVTKPQISADLSFARGGRISSVNTSVGKKVSKGAVLASLDAGELFADLKEAEADLEIQMVKLRELNAGTRPEELAFYESKVKSFKNELKAAEENFWNKFQESYTISDDAIHRSLDQIFSNARGSSPVISSLIIHENEQLAINLKFERTVIENELRKWNEKLNDNLSILEAENIAEENLKKTRDILFMAFEAISRATSNAGVSENSLSNLRSSMAEARFSINSALADIVSAKNSIESAEDNLATSEGELILRSAPARSEQIDAQIAMIGSSKARVERINSQISQTIIRSPFDGIITKQEAEPGETASAGAALISILKPDQLEIEANIPEIDIGEIVLGNKAMATFDAFPGEKFEAEIISIDPDAKFIDGISNYRTIAALKSQDERLKSGLTASLSIITAMKEGAVTVPSVAVFENEKGFFVRRISGSVAEEIPVTTGIRGNDGFLEIISGLAEFDKVILGEN